MPNVRDLMALCHGFVCSCPLSSSCADMQSAWSVRERPLTEIIPNAPPSDGHFPTSSQMFGHPKALWVIVLTEAWVAFSLYGMQSLLVLYMKDSLLQPGHVENIWGFGTLHSAIAWLYSPVGIPALAGAIMGLFLALIYATPLLGGFIADRMLGRTRTILLGAVLMTAGHVMMAFESSFVLAFVCLVFGTGCAGSLRAQVGALYALNDRKRSDAYQFYTLGVQVAVIVSPALCASLGQIAWHWGFLTAGIGMALGLACYLAGRHLLPEEPPRVERSKRLPLTTRERKAVILLLCLIVVLAVGALPNEEIFDGYLLWGQQHYRLSLFGYPFPVGDLLSFDGLISSVTAIGVLTFWQFYAKKRADLSEITKVAIGIGISAFAPLCLAAGSWISPGAHQVSLLWGVAFHTVNDIGFAMSYSIGMALFSRAAPVSLNTIMVACFSLHLFLSNLMVGKLATLISHMSSVSFWVMHSVVAGCAAIVLGIFAWKFRDLLAPEKAPQPQEA